MNHGQISRIERSNFITASQNVCKLCTFFEVAIATNDPLGKPLPTDFSGRFDRLLAAQPSYGALLTALLDALESRNKGS